MNQESLNMVSYIFSPIMESPPKDHLSIFTLTGQAMPKVGVGITGKVLNSTRLCCNVRNLDGTTVCTVDTR